MIGIAFFNIVAIHFLFQLESCVKVTVLCLSCVEAHIIANIEHDCIYM